MAYALRFAGGTEYASFATVNRSDASWRIEFRLLNPETTINVIKRIMGQTSSLNDNINYRWNASGDLIRYRVDGVNVEGNSTPLVTDDLDFHDYTITDDGTDMHLQVDTNTVITVLGGGGKAFKDFNALARSGSARYALDLQYFRYYDTSGVEEKVHDWDATLSDHSAGTVVLTDFGTAGNDATGVTMPTDGSAWINLGGATSSDLTTTISTEADIVTGGSTITLTLTDDTFVASGATFDAERQGLIDNLVSAQSEANGWNAEKVNLPVTDVVRTSDTVVTITLSALANYDITADETITSTIQASALVTSAIDVISAPTFVISSSVAGFNPAWAIGSNTLIH